MSRLRHRQVRRSASCLAATLFFGLTIGLCHFAYGAEIAQTWKGGSGTWDNGVTTQVWTPPMNGKWTNGNDAIFSNSTTGTITIGGTPNLPSANSVSFTVAGYIIGVASGTNALTITGTGTSTTTGTATTSAIDATNTSGTTTFNAPLVLGAAANATQTFTQASGGTLVLNGGITSTNNPVTLNLAGGGTVIVNGTVASSIPVTVNGSGTTLGGTGTINGTVTLGNTTAGAVLNPGSSSSSAGTLTTGALTLTMANTFHADAFGTMANQWDKLIVNGAAVLGSTSSFVLANLPTGLNFTPGTIYTLIDATSISGTFSGYADGSTHTIDGYNFVVHYNLNGDGNFELTCVPEPSTWFAALLALGAIAFSQRKRLRVRARVPL